MSENTTIGKNFYVQNLIGKGDKGVVYQATDSTTEEKIAVKILDSELALNKKFLSGFLKDCSVLNKMENANLVRILNIDQAVKKISIVMEYIEDMSLANWLQEGRTIYWTEALNIFKQTLKTLEEVHRAGILHRNMKPQNIYLTPEGKVKISDWGLAVTNQGVHLTIIQNSLRSLHYMAPEQFEVGDEVDHRSDLYSLAMIFYEVLTGRTPYQDIDNGYNIYRAITRKRIRSPHRYNLNVPAELGKIILKALEKQPGKRYQNAEDMREALERLEAGTAEQPLLALPSPSLSGQGKLPQKAMYAIPGKVFLFFGRYLDKLPLWGTSVSAIVPRVHTFLCRIFKDKFPGVVSRIRAAFPGDFQEKIGKGVSQIRSHLPPLAKDFLPTAVAKVRSKVPEQYRRLIIPLAALVLGTLLILVLLNSYNRETTVEKNSPPAAVEAVSSTPSATDRERIAQQVEAPQPATGQRSLNHSRDTVETAAPVQGSFTVASSPEGAKVFLNNQPMGVTPLKNRQFTEGTYTLRIEKKGYQPFTKIVRITSGQNQRISTDLALYTGKVVLSIKPGGSVYIDGKLYKSDVSEQTAIELSNGTHRITVQASSSGVKWEKSVHIAPNKQQSFDIDFNRTVTLVVTSRPSWGEIIIDGEPTGNYTPKKLTLPVGLHTIGVRRKGFELENGERVLNLEADLSEPLVFTIKEVH